MYHSNIYNPHGSLDLQLPSMHCTKVKTQFSPCMHTKPYDVFLLLRWVWGESVINTKTNGDGDSATLPALSDVNTCS